MRESQLAALLEPRPFRYFKSTGSTNSDLLAWLEEEPDLPNGATIVADEQTAGRGRHGRKWITPPGRAIAMSVLVRYLASPIEATQLAAVSVAEAIDPYAPNDVVLKWPNDIMIRGRKVAGILTEAVWDGDDLRAIVIGVGINVKVNFRGTPLDGRAVSLHRLAEEPVNRPKLIAAVVRQIDFWMECNLYGLQAAWKKRLTMLGKPVVVHAGKDDIKGKAVDVDPEGALLVEVPSGDVQRFLVGDVSLSI